MWKKMKWLAERNALLCGLTKPTTCSRQPSENWESHLICTCIPLTHVLTKKGMKGALLQNILFIFTALNYGSWFCRCMELKGRSWLSQTSKHVGSAFMAALLMSCDSVTAKPLGVNRPELLPQTETTVIDTANYLRFSDFCPYQHTVFSHLILNNRLCSKGQEKKIEAKIQQLESATGIKLRIVCQKLVCGFSSSVLRPSCIIDRWCQSQVPGDCRCCHQRLLGSWR